MHEYHTIVDSKRWEPTNSKKNYQDEPFLLKVYTVAVEDPVKKNAEKVELKSLRNGEDNNSVVGSYTKSVATCHKCGKKGHMKMY